MLVLCIIVTCFICIIYHYYTFSGTNLLTRCHSASSCFLLFLVPEKLFGQYSRNSTKQKPNLLFFRGTHGARRASQGEAHGLLPMGRRGQEGGGAAIWGDRGAHTTWWRGRGPTRAWVWFGHLGALLRLSFGLRDGAGKIRTWPFVSCNSENIRRSTFLE